MNPQDGARMTRFDDQWTSQGRRMTDKTWTGSTNFEEETTYKDQYITDDADTQQAALPARGIRAPQQQPTEQERREHNLTHLPYRSWCTICVETKGRANNHPTQKTSTLPVIQCDFASIKGIHDKQVIPVLPAIDVETGMSMATMVQDKQRQFTYLTQCLQTFLIECGRTQAIWRQQFYNQTKRNISCHCRRQQREQLEATLQLDNHQHTVHNHKEALRDSTEHYSIK